MEFAGLPFHFLILHAAVVFTPLAGTSAIAFAVLPRWRYLTRWPTAALTLIALVCVWLSRISGQAYLSENPQLAPLVQTHMSRGVTLSLLMILFTVVVAVGVWGLGGRSGFASGSGAVRTRVAAFDKLLPAALIVTSLLVLVWVFLTGDAGARAVWGR
jgi:hypothetical protein